MHDVVGAACYLVVTLSILSLLWTGRGRLWTSANVLIVSFALYFGRVTVRFADNAWGIGVAGTLAQSQAVVMGHALLMAAAALAVAWDSWRMTR